MTRIFDSSANRDRAHRNWRRHVILQHRLRNFILGGSALTLIGSAIVSLAIFIVSNTGQVAHAAATWNAPIVDLQPDYPTPFHVQQPAGNEATLQLTGTVYGILLDIPSDGKAKARQDTGLYVDVTCSVTATSLVGAVIHFDLSQVAIIDGQTGQISLEGPPLIGAHSAYFWQITNSGPAQATSLPFAQGVQITANITATRFGRGDIPIESYEFFITLTIQGNGMLSCGIDDP